MLEQIKKNGIALIVYDFDGVMTDNKVLLSEDGKESVVVNRSDGLAVSLIKKQGILQVIISTEKNKVVIARANKLKIPVLNGIDNKKDALGDYCKKKGIDLKCVVYIGNDLNDLEAMRIVGFPICPGDAHVEIKRISKIIMCARGGCGVVREFFDYLR